jgi:hypothetical protein
VQRLTSRSLQRADRHPAQIVGLVTPATHVSDPTLMGPLRELESQIIDRANWLADELLANPPDWYRELRRAANTTPDQEPTELAREIAAYRERYQIQSHSILGDAPPTNAVERRRQHSRLMNMLAGFSTEAAQRSADGAGFAEVPTQSVLPPLPD